MYDICGLTDSQFEVVEKTYLKNVFRVKGVIQMNKDFVVLLTKL